MATQKTAESEDPRLKKLVRVYLKMKAKRDEITEAFKKQEKELDDQMAMVKSALLDYCNETGLEGARTTEGMFFRTVTTRYGANDWGAIGSFIVENNLPELFEKRLHQGNVKQYLEDNPEVIVPGLVADPQYSITIRRK